MNNRAFTLSIIMGVIAVLFVQSYVTSIEEEAKKKFGTEVLALTAKRDIKEMETITEVALEFNPIPKKFLEPSAISLEITEDDRAHTRTMRGISGAVAMVPIKKGEQLSWNKISEPGMKTGLSTQVAPGRRAIAIAVNDITATSKLVKPGDRVDVIMIVDGGGAKDNRLAKTLFQDVVVLSIGRYVANNVARVVEQEAEGGGANSKERVRSLAEDFGFTSVTLELDPIQAQMVVLVHSLGDHPLYLTLRNNDDSDKNPINSLSFMDVMGADASRIHIQGGGKKF